ncbi:M28 family peptidase, partial [bacterium]|nr:M28 family peptidase [bacterium]
MSKVPLLLLLLPAILFGAEYISPVPAGSPPPEGIYHGLAGGYELYLTRTPLPGSVEIDELEIPLYLVSSYEGPVQLPGISLVYGALPDGSVICRMTLEELIGLSGDPNLYFRRLLPVVRAPEPTTPAGDLFPYSKLIEDFVDEVELGSIMAYNYDLTAFRTRYTTSAGNFQSQDYLYALLEGYGYDVLVERAFLGSLYHVAADGGLVAMSGGMNRAGGGCFYSNNSGTDFGFFRAPRNPYALSWGGLAVFSPGNIHYATDRAYYRSTDGGKTWTETEILDDEYDRIICMFFADEDVGYIFTISGQVFRSSDGGSSWEPRGSGLNQIVAAASPVGSHDVVVASPGACRIIRSIDGGLTWDLVYMDGFQDSCADFAFEDGERGLGVGDWVFSTTDAGETWERLDNPSLDQPLASVSNLGPGEYLICGVWGGLWHTDDGGETWEDRSDGLDSVESPITDTAYDDGRFWVLCSDYPGYSDDEGYGFTWLPDWLPVGEQSLAMTNVIGERRGTTHPDEYVYATAHYDSISGDSDPMVLAPGADDNGSGSTALLELARILAPYENQRTLRIAFFDAEEWGLLGSHYHVNRIASEGYDVIGAINLDMIVWSDDPEVQEDLEVVGRYEDEWLVDLMIEACDRYGDGLTWVKWLNGRGCSDHAAFWDAGYYAILGIEDSPITYPYYHSKDDDYPNIEDHFPFTRQVTRAAAGALAHLIGLWKRPEGFSGVSVPYAYPNPFRGGQHSVI